LNDQCNVLIVDRSEETREVLQTVLERRGVRTMSAGKAQTGLELARRHRPELIVLDLELDDMPAEQFARPAEQECLPAQQQPSMLTSSTYSSAARPEYEPYLVVLGSLRGRRGPMPNGEFVAKPYHYGPLIRRIEELLEGQAGPETSLPQQLGHGLCQRYSSSAAPIRGAASS
jgi:CheY-like chemotaxis protein